MNRCEWAVGLTMPAAREFAQFDVRALTTAPGIFLTPLLLKLPEEVQASLGASVPYCIRNAHLSREATGDHTRLQYLPP